MPFERPTLPELIERAVADIETRLPGTDARLRRSNLNVLARVHAGAVHGLYGYLDYLSKQLMVDTAEQSYLERYSSIWGVLRLPAAFAAGAVTFTGTTGAVVPAGTELQRADGQVYTTTAEVTIAGGTVTATVQAHIAGAAGNADSGVVLTMIAPITGVNSAAPVGLDGISQGADVEADENLRSRILRRIQEPPHGGDRADYVAWALEVPGVTRAWCYPLELGPGTVTVRFVRDNDLVLIPDAAEVTAVQAHIDSVRPVTAEVTVVAPIAVLLNPQIQLVPDTAEVRAAVEAELTDLLQRRAEPGGTLLLSQIREAISIASGETDHILVAPVANVEHGAGEMAALGAIAWL